MPYQKEAWDCDDFAMFAVEQAHECHALTPNHPTSGIAFGSIRYTKSDGVAHAINIFLVNESSDPYVLDLKACFFEPQTQEIITLNKKEKESITLIEI